MNPIQSEIARILEESAVYRNIAESIEITFVGNDLIRFHGIRYLLIVLTWQDAHNIDDSVFTSRPRFVCYFYY